VKAEALSVGSISLSHNSVYAQKKSSYIFPLLFGLIQKVTKKSRLHKIDLKINGTLS